MIGQSYETPQTLDADALADPRFLEESWTLGVSAAIKNRQQRIQQQATHPRTSCEFDSLGSDFFLRLRQWDAQQAAPTQSAEDPSAKLDAEDAQTDANLGWDTFNATRESRRVLSQPNAMNVSLACQLLDVTANSSREQIRSAYRRMVSQWHPDRLQRSSEETRQLANEQMIAINEAYRLLCDGQLQNAA